MNNQSKLYSQLEILDEYEEIDNCYMSLELSRKEYKQKYFQKAYDIISENIENEKLIFIENENDIIIDGMNLQYRSIKNLGSSLFMQSNGNIGVIQNNIKIKVDPNQPSLKTKFNLIEKSSLIYQHKPQNIDNNANQNPRLESIFSWIDKNQSKIIKKINKQKNKTDSRSNMKVIKKKL